MLKLRLRQCGRKQRTIYRIVSIDVRSRREVKPLRKVGFYDPINNQTSLNFPDILYFGCSAYSNCSGHFKEIGVFTQFCLNQSKRNQCNTKKGGWMI
uniref:ribosomal protein S16 n=1 Tax=Pristimera indica TaxID=123465 RepID=UPI0021ABE16E|nr:ribosomal protein S16 [Pristimera indica]UUA69509.1 ribosomal protein S16 [Pristimera indica]